MPIGSTKPTPPTSFTGFYEAVKRLMDTLGRAPEGMPAAVLATRGVVSPVGHKIRLLPPSPKELARSAEATPEFGEFASDSIKSKGSEQYHASILLRRSGFYHGILSGASQAELWSSLSKYTRPRTAEIHTLLLLDGCKFPRGHFSGLSSVALLLRLCPLPQAFRLPTHVARHKGGRQVTRTSPQLRRRHPWRPPFSLLVAVGGG